MLNPGWLASETEAGVALSHAGPTGTGNPATDRLVICRVMLDVVLTAPVFRLTFPVVAPFWMKATVAVTGIRPSSLNDPVAGGRFRLAVTAPVLRFTLDFRVPGPRLTVALAALRNVLPWTGYLTLITVPAAEAAGAAAIVTAATSPARAITVAPRAARVRRNGFMRSPWSRDSGGMNGDSSSGKQKGQPPGGAGQCRQSGGCPSGASGPACLLRGSALLRGRHRVGAGELRGVAAVDQAGAPADAPDVQVPAGAEHLELVRAVGVGDLHRAGGACGAAGDVGAAARARQLGLDAGDGAGRDAAGGVVRGAVQRPGEVLVADREGQVQRAGSVAE